MFALLSTLALVITIVGASDCDSAPGVNGCSTPGDINFFYKRVFKSDCNKHDVCYACGSYWQVDREECDDRFLRNMKRTCEIHPDVKSEFWCKITAHVYHIAVDTFGDHRYKDDSPAWCQDSGYLQCIN